MSISAITATNLSFRYADSERWILRDVSLSVRAGETLLILGPSGCGKSTLALCLNGLIPNVIEGEMQGEVRVWGQPASALWSAVSPSVVASNGTRMNAETAQIGADAIWSATIPIVASSETRRKDSSHSRAFVGEVFQDPETQMVMPRADEEIAFGLENTGVAPAEMPARIAAALRLVGLDDRPRAWVDSLSGGQKQRLALASVLALQPAILVLDEPTANLDPAATADFYRTLARLKADLGLTVVLIEHRLDAVLPLLDCVVVMSREGQVISQGTPHEVFARHSDEMEREGVWLPMTCRLMRALRDSGAPAGDCPLTLDEVEDWLRVMWSATTPVVAPLLPNAGGNGGPRRLESSHSTPAIALRDLTFAYPDSTPALRNVNLQIERGRFFALVGANGSGKTTLAKHLVGLLRPASGSVTVLRQETRRRSPGELARQAGYVFQNPEHQFVTERVADELAYSLRGRWPQAEIAQRVGQLLSIFGLQGYEDENPFALSQGQKRRLSVATMVALDQPILILDEPTFGQDRAGTEALMATLKRPHAAGTTIVFITHDMQLVAEYAEEVAVMHDGQVIFQGSPRDLFQQPGILREASLILPPLAELARRLGLPPLLTVEEWGDWARELRSF